MLTERVLPNMGTCELLSLLLLEKIWKSTYTCKREWHNKGMTRIDKNLFLVRVSFAVHSCVVVSVSCCAAAILMVMFVVLKVYNVWED